jgi:DNA processing protein
LSETTTSFSSPDERRAILALTLVADVGSVTHRQLIERFGTARRVLDGAFSARIAEDAYAAADRMLDSDRARALTLTTASDPSYPDALRELHDPPPLLWSIGSFDIIRAPVVAVVGTRRATPYAYRMTRAIVQALVRGGATIVSGMALGVDAVAHTATLEANGNTVAVLGTGADIAYPRGHVTLHRTLAARGLVLSELPPGARADAGSFPRRNRIIAGLAQLTIVVEAPLKSGALITATVAMDLGRDVAAVPGPIDSPQSEGSNALIRDGAHAITCVADALALVGLAVPTRCEPELRGAAETSIWTALNQGAATLDELCARTALPVAQCLAAITGLELRGVLECALTGEIRRR